MQIYVEVLFHMKYCLCCNKVPLLFHLQYHSTPESICPSVFTRLTDSIIISNKRSSSFHLQNTTVKQTPVNAYTSYVHTPTHSQAQPMLSPVGVLVEGQVIWNFKYFRDTLQSLQPDLAAPFHVNCTEKLMECHKVWTLEDDLVKTRW